MTPDEAFHIALLRELDGLIIEASPKAIIWLHDQWNGRFDDDLKSTTGLKQLITYFREDKK